MLRITLRILLLLALSTSFSYAQNFVVNNYSAEFFIEEEGYLDVKEKYNLTFYAHKHGIYRNIQLHYNLKNEEGNIEERKIKVKKVEVPKWKFVTSNKIINDLTGNLEIKIGDANVTVTGPQEYDIHYRVENVFLFEKEATQFYWNLKPSEWYADFEAMQFKVYLPEGISIDRNDVKLYSGSYGASQESEDFNLDINEGVITIQSNEGYVSRYGDSVTLWVKLPENSVKELKPFWPFGAKYGWTFLIIAMFGTFYYLWRKYGKDDAVISATNYYPPEEMDPAMAGFLIDDKSDTSDLISLLPYWGSKGYITMTEIDKKGLFAKDDTRLEKLKKLPNTANSYERKMFNNLFKGGKDQVLISSLKDSFYTTMTSAKSLLKAEAQPYYLPKSRAVKKMVTGALILLLFLLTPIVLYFWGLLAAGSVVLSCFVLLFLNIYMIKKNTKGNKTLAHLKGFRQFVKLAEANRLQTLIKEDPYYFESTMAYALAFGYFDKWANKFKDLNVPAPKWYNSSTPHSYSMNSFSKSFTSSMSTAKSTMVSTPSSSGSGSSGGGFSGGGFGGGGGGSW